jgi:hypothetical protein
LLAEMVLQQLLAEMVLQQRPLAAWLVLPCWEEEEEKQAVWDPLAALGALCQGSHQLQQKSPLLWQCLAKHHQCWWQEAQRRPKLEPASVEGWRPKLEAAVLQGWNH